MIHLPHIDQRFLPQHIMVEHQIAARPDTFCDLLLNVRLHNPVCPIKVLQIQAACFSVAYAFWFEYKSLGFGIHNIKHRVTVIKFFRQRFVKRIINIFHIQICRLFAIPDHRTFHGIRPCSHTIDICLGNRQSFHLVSRGKIKAVFPKHLSCTGNAFPFSIRNHRQLYHRLITMIRINKILRLIHQSNLIRQHALKFCFFIKNRLYRTF